MSLLYKNKALYSQNDKKIMKSNSTSRYKLNKFNKKTSKKKLPPINFKQAKDNEDITSKIKKASLSKSISYLYKSLFPDEKNSVEHFFENYSYTKFLKKPDWRYTFLPINDSNKVKQNLMMKNKVMKYYNKMKSPSKLKKEVKRKPRMVEIIEDNCTYKNRVLYHPFEEDFSILNIKKKLGIGNARYNNQGEEGNNIGDGDNEDEIDNNQKKNKFNINNLYKENIMCCISNNINLHNIYNQK
jgi:hypothetical protein